MTYPPRPGEFGPAETHNWRIVTQDQLDDGYLVRTSGGITTHEYEVLFKCEDGTYMVREPDLPSAEEVAKRLRAMGIRSNEHG